MSKRISASIFLLLLALPVYVLAGDGGSSLVYPDVVGVMGVVPALENSCAAVWIAIPQGKALTGLDWYNNDESAFFPGLYFESGAPDYPLALTETLLAAENVSGGSSAWSTVSFSEPVTCASEGLYVIFRFPEDVQATGFGEGGGPAIGYVGESQGATGWLCSDGESWQKVGGEFGFAVLPVLVDATPGMLQLQGGPASDDAVEMVVPFVTALQAPYPNPFNPSTTLQFSVAQAQDVDLAVYDVRGRLVVRLAHGVHDAGSYKAVWSGEDQNGRRMASGVYFARFEAGHFVMNQRLVLLK